MELLQWAYDEKICVAKEDDMICHNAIAHGHIDIFQWAIKNGFVFKNHDIAGYEACKNGHLEALKFLIDNDDYDVEVGGGSYGESCGYCNSAACKGQLDIVIWLHENYEPNCNGNTLVEAISSGHVPTVKYLLEKDCGWDDCDDPYQVAAIVGPLEIIQLLHSHDSEWDEDAIVEKAAEGGHLDIVQWAKENGCPLTESACQYAAGFGHFDTLKGLRDMGCPWDEGTTTYASTDEIYNWATKNGCPVAKGKPREKLERSFDWLSDE